MEVKNCAELSNSEIKEYNEFEATKAKIKELCTKLTEIEHAYTDAQTEINLRRTIF